MAQSVGEVSGCPCKRRQPEWPKCTMLNEWQQQQQEGAVSVTTTTFERARWGGGVGGGEDSCSDITTGASPQR